MKLSILFLFISCIFHAKLFAAACCGANFSAPSLISGDEKAKFVSAVSVTKTTVQYVDSSGLWSKETNGRYLQKFDLAASHIFKDRWQFGTSFSVQSRLVDHKDYQGVGDIKLNIAYEALPDWDYHPYRPKGIVYFQINAPTGKTTIESEEAGSDVFGSGQWAYGVGSLLSKIFLRWDALFNIEVHRKLEKNIDTPVLQTKILASDGFSANLGLGYNWSSWRIGSNVALSYENSVAYSDASINKKPLERFVTAGASLSYLYNSNWSGTFGYSDQTLIGNPANTSLGKTVFLQLQRFWAR